MSIVPINPAEAIIAPLFDSQLSNLHEFTLQETARTDGQVTQEWDSCSLTSAAQDFSLVWRGLLTLDAYDALRCFVTFAPEVRLSGSAVVDGERLTLFTDIAGAAVPIEPTSGPLIAPGATATLTEYRLDFHAPGETPAQVTLRWVGLLSTLREHLIEEALPKYDSAWEGLLHPDGQPGLTETLLLPAEDYAVLKERCHLPAFAALAQQLRAEAQRWEGFDPEPEIRAYIPCAEHMYRYVRERDRHRTVLEGPVVTLAVAGYLFDRPDWSRLAARMMLAIAHTPHWYEGPQGGMPGSSWHHVCFMEDHYSTAMALALQFMGDILTPAAVAKVLDGIERAWQVVDEKCAEPGYRWYMNQGLVGNRGRIIGALCLWKHGRGTHYRDAVEQSYRDHSTILDHYLNDEGHCYEGPGYFQYSFHSSIPLWMAYAHATGAQVRDVIPAKFFKCLPYVEAMLSSTAPTGHPIPLSATQAGPLSTLLLGFLAGVCGWQRGFGYLRRRLEGTGAMAAENIDGLDALILLAIMPLDPPEIATAAPGIGGCHRSGLLTYEFPAPARGKFWLCCERNSAGHYHQDRGSIILEANGQTLLPDPGTTNYSHPVCNVMKTADWHNLAYPVGLQMALTTYSAGVAQLDEIQALPQGVRFSANLAPVYGDQVTTGRRDGQLVLESGVGRLTVRDHWALREAHPIRVTFQSYAPWDISGQRAVTRMGQTRLDITVHDAAGAPLQLRQDTPRCDAQLTPVYALVIETEARTETVVHSQITFTLE